MTYKNNEQNCLSIAANAHWTRNSPQYAFIIKRFFLFWIPLVCIAAAMVWTLYRAQQQSADKIMRAGERDVVRVAAQLSTAELETVRSDLLFLAEQASQSGWPLTRGSQASIALASTFLSFAANRAVYDQVRFIDVDGRELVRVNWNRGFPAIVGTAKLQDKSDRPYVRESLLLESGDVYVSPFDLNIEHKVVERPLKPVIRFGTPVFDDDGKLRGIVVLNYLGERLLQRLRAISGPAGQLWMLNDAGYWLLGPSADDEWRFMFPDQPQAQLQRRDPAAWQAIRNGPDSGQILTANAFYTYAKISPLAPSHSVVAREGWVLLSAVPQAAVPWPVGPWGVTTVAALLLAACAWAVAYYSARRHVAEQQVRASEAQFRSLVEAAPDAMVIVDRDGRIVLANDQAESCFGYTQQEMDGQSIELLVPEKLRAPHAQDRARYIADPYRRAMGEGKELYARRKDGGAIPVEISLSPLETPQGQVVIAAIRDVSVRKQSERLRAEAQARYHTLVNNLPVGVYRKTPGPRGRFIEVNPALVAMLEAESAEQLLNHAVSDFHRDPKGRAALSERLLANGMVVNDEIEMVTLKGRTFCGALTAVVKREPDGEVYFDGIIVDVTERKQIEQQLQKRTIELEAINRELEAFSYSVSHDLRAPLRAIDGFSRILLDTCAEGLDDVGRDQLDRVRRAAQHMGQLIDDLLKLSRVTRAALKHERVDLSVLTTQVAEEIRHLYPGHRVRLTVAPGISVEGDPGLLRIVMTNLLHNAWKFTGKRADPEVGFGVTMHNGKTAYVVSDNGSGFDMRYADKLFGAFQRLHDTREFTGTGIGLATVQRIVRKHGGQIWAESAPNEGARFYFTLGAEGQA